MTKQKKPTSRILSLILAGALAVSLLPFSAATAFADSGEPTDSNAPVAFAAIPAAEETQTLFFNGDGKLYIGALEMGDPPTTLTTQYVGQEGKWSVNGDTLKLKGFTFETTADTALWVTGDAKLVLENGTVNTIKSGKTAVKFSDPNGTRLLNCEIRSGGTLQATGGEYGIGIYYTANLSITGAKIVAQAGQYALLGGWIGSATTEQVGGTLVITDSDVSATGTGAYGSGIFADAGNFVKIVNSKINVRGGHTAIYVIGIALDEGSDVIGTADGSEPTEGSTAVLNTSGTNFVLGSDPAGTDTAKWVIITPPPKEKLEITATAATGLVYSGQPQAGVTNVSVSENKVPVGELVSTYTGRNSTVYEESTIAPTDAGDYSVVLSVAKDNETYMGKSEAIDFTIAKKPVTVKPKNFSIAPGAALPTFVLAFDGIVNGESLTPSVTATFTCEKDGVPVDGKTAGTYDIVWNEYGTTTFTGDENYIVAKQEKGTLTVETPRTNSPSSGGGKSSWTPTTSANVIDVPEGNLGLGTYNNYDKLLVQGLEKLVEQNKGKTVNFDTVENGKVLYRIKLDPAKLSGVLKNDLSLSAHIGQNDAAVLEVTNRFAKYYGNNIVAITYAQAKPLGVSAEFAARLDLSKLNAKTLYFYSYDNTTNTYARIAYPGYFVDVNGYSHITAPLGGSILITDKPLASK